MAAVALAGLAVAKSPLMKVRWWPRDWIAGAGALAMAGALAGVASVGGGCDGPGECTGIYHCPLALYGEVDVPADLPAPVSSVTADGSCSTFRTDTSPTAPIVVSVKGTVAAGTTLTCQVRAQLADGTKL